MDALVGGIPSFHQPSSLLYSFYDDNTNVSTKTKYIVGAARNGGIQIRYLSPEHPLAMLYQNGPWRSTAGETPAVVRL